MPIEIEPKEILPCLAEERIFARGFEVDNPSNPAIVYCGKIRICMVRINSDGTHIVLRVACSHPRHGVHERFKEVAKRLELLAPKPKGLCPSCHDDSGWLAPLSEQSQKQVMAGSVFGYYRGIAIPKTIGQDSKEGSKK